MTGIGRSRMVGGFSAVALGAIATLAAAGAVPTGFGRDGKVTTAFGSTASFATALVLQPDGKLVAAGERDSRACVCFALARYNSDGSLDAGFGRGGKVTTAIGTGFSGAKAVVLEPDGKLVAAGAESNTSGARGVFALVRYNSDGSLDTSFGRGGTVTTAIGVDAGLSALVIQPDGKLVAAGYSKRGTVENGSLREYFTLVRYERNGSVDRSFGRGGTVTTPIGPRDSSAYALALQPDGKLVAAGGTDPRQGITDVAVVRYEPNGSLDKSFGRSGRVETNLGPTHNPAHALVVQPDGKLVVASSSGNDIALVRYLANGKVDKSFGHGGKATTAVESGGSSANALVLQPNGKLVVAGLTFKKLGRYDYSNQVFALARYDRKGSLDTTFGQSGTVSTSVGSGISIAFAVIQQPDGKLVAGGSWQTGSLKSIHRKEYFALVRYRPDGSLDKPSRSR